MAKNILASKEKYRKEFMKFSEHLLPEYEKNCIQEYIGNESQNLDDELPIQSMK